MPMYVGDKKNPLAIDKKGKLLANLDEEFYQLLDDAYMHISGFMRISVDKMNIEYSEAYIYAVRYLVLQLQREYNGGNF